MSTRTSIRLVSTLRTRSSLLLGSTSFRWWRRSVLSSQILIPFVLRSQLFQFLRVLIRQSSPTPLNRFVVNFFLKCRHIAELDSFEFLREIFQYLSLLASEYEWCHHLFRSRDSFAREEVRLVSGSDLEDGAKGFVGISELFGKDEGKERL